MKRYAFSLLLAAFITIVSIIPIPEPPLDIPFKDKWVHFIMYGVLSLTMWWEYIRSHPKVSWLQGVIIAILLPIAFSGLLELAQAYLTTCRSGEWLDLAANSVGVLISTFCVCIYLLVKRKG